MKKLLLIGGMFAGLFADAQTYPYTQNFDAMTAGVAPTGGWSTFGFTVMAGGHANSLPNACSVEMMTGHNNDTLVTPLIGPLSTTSELILKYRIVDAALYPATAYTLGSTDGVTIDAYIGSWQNGAATINASNQNLTNQYAAYTYVVPSLFAGQNVKIRIDVKRAAGDWFLDIDDFSVANSVGVSYSLLHPPSIIAMPNPSHENFIIWVKNYQSGNPVVLKIYNQLGQVVKTLNPAQLINNQFEVNSSDMSKGIYFAEVINGNEHATTKIIIE